MIRPTLMDIVEELHYSAEEAVKEIAELRAELEIAREALEWYADSSNYKLRYIPKRAMEMPIVDDEGQRARAALSGEEPKSRGAE